jgi:hypothetical protein
MSSIVPEKVPRKKKVGTSGKTASGTKTGKTEKSAKSAKSATAKSATAKSATAKSATAKTATAKTATAKTATAKTATAKTGTTKTVRRKGTTVVAPKVKSRKAAVIATVPQLIRKKCARFKELSRDRMDFIRRMVGGESTDEDLRDEDYNVITGGGGLSIRFYDDSPDNISDVRKDMTIECIHVPRVNRKVPPGTCDGGKNLDYCNYVKKKGGWKLDTVDSDLASVLEYYMNKDDFSEEDTSDSLTENGMRELRTWACTNRNASDVIFDFDRVINLTEGIMGYDTPSDLHERDLRVSGLAKYHMGTKSRLMLFRRVLNELTRRNVRVHVVSNNEAAATPLFSALLHAIHPAFHRDNIYASCTYKTKLHCIRQKGLATR